MFAIRTVALLMGMLVLGTLLFSGQPHTCRNCGEASPVARSIDARATAPRLEVPITVQTLRQFARQNLVEAERVAATEPRPMYKTSAYTEIGSAWRRLEARSARRLLERAWQLSQGIIDVHERSTEQRDIVLDGWAGFDTERGRELIPHIKDSYWRNYAVEKFAQSVAQFDLKAGARLLMGIHGRMNRDREVTEAAYDIMRDDPDRAAQLALRVTNIDSDELITAVIANISSEVPDSGVRLLTYRKPNISSEVPDDGMRLLKYLKSDKARDEGRGYVVARLATDNPAEAVRLALQIKATRPRMEALVAAAIGIEETNREQARDLVRQSAALVEKLRSEDDRFFLLVELAPKIALIDSRVAAKLLEGLHLDRVSYSHSALCTLELAGAWASIDLRKAETLFQTAIKLDKTVCIDEHGQNLNSSFEAYVAGLAATEPKRAAGLFKEYAKSAHSPLSSSNQQEDDARYQDFLGQYIVDKLLARTPDQALAFAEAYAGTEKRKAVALQLLALKARSNPEQAESVLPLLKNDFNHCYEHDSVCRQVSMQLAWKDSAAAERVVQMIKEPDERVYGYCELARILFAKHDSHAILLLQQARKAATEEKTAFHRASALKRVASTALYGIRYVRKSRNG